MILRWRAWDTSNGVIEWNRWYIKSEFWSSFCLSSPRQIFLLCISDAQFSHV